jgi:hypothetical protein
MLRALGVLALLSATAAAEPTLELTIEDKAVEATVRGAPKPIGEVVLRELDVGGTVLDDQTPIPASSVRGFLDGGPVAIAFVVCSSEIWTGEGWAHDEYEVDRIALFKPLADALSRLGLATQLPEGSEALLVVYSTGAEIKAPWQPARDFDGADLGSANDHRGKIGSDLVRGIELAYEELAKRPERRKLMIVVGDGNDTDGDDGAYNLRLAAEAHEGVTLAALVVKSPVSSDSDIVGTWTDNVVRFTGADYTNGIEAALKKTVQFATDQFEATFDLARFPRTGKRHVYQLVADTQPTAAVSLMLLDPPPPPAPPHQIWRWLVLAGVVGAFSLLSLLVFRARGPR